MIEPFTFIDRSGPGKARGVERNREIVDLVEVLADDEDAFALMLPYQLLDDLEFRWGGGGEAVAGVIGGGGVLQPLLLRQVDAHLVAVRWGDEALRLDLLPGGVEPFRADEAEDIALATVLAHESRGEAEPATGLQLGGELENGCRQQMHLVVDHEAPVECVEQSEVRVLSLTACGENLIGRNGDRFDLFHLAGVLADLLLGERGALEQFGPPLPGRYRVRHQDQRGGLRRRHRTRADERLARATGQHHDT